MDLWGAAHLQSEGELGQMGQMCGLHAVCAWCARVLATKQTPSVSGLEEKSVFFDRRGFRSSFVETFSGVGTQEREETPPNSCQRHSAKLRQT